MNLKPFQQRVVDEKMNSTKKVLYEQHCSIIHVGWRKK